jgi:hypothetical protein
MSLCFAQRVSKEGLRAAGGFRSTVTPLHDTKRISTTLHVTGTARSNVGKLQYRRILNMPDVVRAIEAAGYAVTMADFAGMSLREQVWHPGVSGWIVWILGQD